LDLRNGYGKNEASEDFADYFPASSETDIFRILRKKLLKKSMQKMFSVLNMNRKKEIIYPSKII
jgi:nitrogenase subunit NifH